MYYYVTLYALLKFDSIHNILQEIDSIEISKSDYCDIENCNTLIQNPDLYLKILNQNIRSLSNIPDLQVMLARTGIDWDLIILTECRLRDTMLRPPLNGSACNV